MLAVLDLTSLAPDFVSGATQMHSVLFSVAFVACVAGLIHIAVQAFREHGIGSIKGGLVKCTIVALLLVNLGTLGNWVTAAIDDVGSSLGLSSGNVFALYTAAIKAKFGIDLSQLNQLVPNGPFGNATSSSSETMLTHYAYPGDSTPDPASQNGVGNHNNQLTAFVSPGQTASAALTASAAQFYGVSLGQTFAATSGSGQTYNLRYDDTAPESDMRIDIYDPNGLLAGGNGFSDSVISVADGPAVAQDSGIGGFVNAMIHPAEAAGAAFFGLVVLFLSYVALFIMWIVALIQAVLLYSLWALSPVFLGFLMVRPLENVGKSFLLNFFSIAIWPIAFIVSSLFTRLFISMALNTGNNPTAGASNVMGMQYFWMIGTALWVVISSIWGPWIVSKRFAAGATGLTELAAVAAGAAMRAVRQLASGATTGIGGLSGGAGAPPSGNGSRPQQSLAPNYARRPMTSEIPKV
jgi:hypothetical protein